MARPRKQLPAGGLDIIRNGASRCLCEVDLARALGMSVTTWRRIRDEDPAAREAWEGAKAVEEQSLVGKMADLAYGTPAEFDESGNMVRAERPPDREAIRFLLLTRHNYRDKGEPPPPPGSGGVTIVLPGSYTPDEYRAQMRAPESPPHLPQITR